MRALMRRQLGLISTARALQYISEAAITRRVKLDEWERVLPGVLDDEDLTAVVEDAINRGVTTSIRQHPVRCGGITYHIDVAFPQWRVSVEGVGDKFHRSPRQRKQELERLADLASVD
jgi:hypothetical protein